MGLGTIMEARCCILLAYGEGKSQAIQESVEGPMTAWVPATILQIHECAKMLIDEGAASKLQRIDYYKWVYDNKPDWQKI